MGEEVTTNRINNMNNEMNMEMVPQTQSSAMVEVEKQKGLGTVMAMIAVAKKFPRDQALALANLTRSCQRKGLAEISQYTYSRGGTEINGPSVNLLRAVAQSWGNIQSGWQEVERRPGESTVRSWASDLESNTHEERTFIVKHWRDTKSGGYLLKDERDIYELLANQAARRLRGCLQGVIPQDIVELAVEECDKTLARGGGVPLADRIRSMVAKFSEVGVTKEQIEKRLGHNIEATKETELAQLGKVFNSIRDGVGTVADHFASVAEVVADAPKSQAAITMPAAAPRKRRSTMTMVEEYVPGNEATPEPEPTTSAPIMRVDSLAASQPPTPTTSVPGFGEASGPTVQDQLAEFVTGQCKSSFDAMRKLLRELGWDTQPGLKEMADWGGFDEMPTPAATKIWNARRGLEMRLKGSV